MPWKSRHRDGQPFYSPEDPKIAARRRAIQQGRHLPRLLAETETYDINTTMQNLASDARQHKRELQKAERQGSIADAKLQLIDEVLRTLEEIRRTGRTRIGDSELKQIIRNTARNLKIPPQALKFKSSDADSPQDEENAED